MLRSFGYLLDMTHAKFTIHDEKKSAEPVLWDPDIYDFGNNFKIKIPSCYYCAIDLDLIKQSSINYLVCIIEESNQKQLKASKLFF